jgi:hypothetical protein
MPATIVAGDTALVECAALLRDDFASFAAWFFRELNPRTRFAMNWHRGHGRRSPERPAKAGRPGRRRCAMGGSGG